MPSSVWRDEVAGQMPVFGALEGDRRADVCVVGGGITGLTTALLLRRSGFDVILLEADRIGSGTTGSTSAHLTAMPDMRPPSLRSRVGDAAAEAAVRANRTGIE